MRDFHKLAVSSANYKKYLKESTPVLDTDRLEPVRIERSPIDDEIIDFDPSDVGSESESLQPKRKHEDKSLDWAEEECYDSEEDEDFVMDEESSLEEESDVDMDNGSNNEESNVNLNQDVPAVQNENTDFVLREFSEWLASCDGGEKKIESIQQQIRQVLTIISYVDPNNQNVASLMKRVDVRNKWLTPFKTEVITRTGKKRQPGTIRSYCNSLRLFSEFLEISKIQKELHTDDIRSIQTQAKAWARHLRKQSGIREHQKIYEDHDAITTPKEVMMFQNSQPCREAVNILERFSHAKPGNVPTQSEYTLCRDFLFWHLSLDNGSRPGQFVGMTISDFEKARTSYVPESKEDYRVVTVFDHKTADAHGPARVVFSTSLYSWFRIFIYNIRNKYYGLPTGSDSPIFVTHTGNVMQSKNISGRLSSLWAKGIKEIKSGKAKMNNTLIRKSIQTFVRREHKDMKEAVSNKLLHHEKTAERYYNVIRKGEEATQTSKFISNMFKGSSTISKMPNESKKVDELDKENQEKFTVTSSRDRWSEDDINSLQHAFKDVKEITMANVRNKLDECGEELSMFKGNLKQVVDKLRYMRKCDGSNLDLESLPQEENAAEKMMRNGLVQVSLNN